jgi:hypothetical protein
MSSELQQVLDRFQQLEEFVRNHCIDEDANTKEQLRKLEQIESTQNDFRGDVRTIKDTVINIDTRLQREEQETQNIYKMIGLVKERVSKAEAVLGMKPATIVGLFTTKNLLIVGGVIVLVSAFSYGVINDGNVEPLLDKAIEKIPGTSQSKES